MRGIDLKVLRLRQGMKAMDVAKILGVTPGRVCQVEKKSVVPERWIVRYSAALSGSSEQRARSGRTRGERGGE